MIEMTIDGTKLSVPEGTTVLEAANLLDIPIPHFCYHKKLSLAANCRMCLVEVEKTPKPMPACTTVVAAGMSVSTTSQRTKEAQRSVMEFLLINHPLDCPICDQGGECQLQDLAVGYGPSASRYTEPKRVVFHKDIGPLVSAEEMTRCIHCTRCVRFGSQIGGVMELGMAGRGEHAEILSFLGRSIESEVSGNMIDICPVGALTSKPFRYAARTWELGRRKSISPHDSLGSNLIVQVKGQRAMRVVPLEVEQINECWLSDRDRFSYEGLYAADRLTRPMLRHAGGWREVEWEEALNFVASALNEARSRHGGDAIGALVSPAATLEEMFLLGQLVRGLGSDHIDFRLRQSDFSADAARRGAPWLGMPVAALNRLDRVLLVGSFLRKDHPLMAVRLRDATRHGCQLSVVHAVDDEPLMPVAHRAITAPSGWTGQLARIASAVAQNKGFAAPSDAAPDEVARGIADSLCSGANAAVLLGNAALQHPEAAAIGAWAQWIAEATGARLGVPGEAANSVGGYLAAARPLRGGLNARTMLEQPRPLQMLWNCEPEYDTADPALAARALAAAECVISFTAFRNGALEYAHALLPIAPFTETSGTFVNAEGRVQSFNGATHPHGEARPGWKVLRVLGNLLGLAGFDYESPEEVRDAALPAVPSAWLSNELGVGPPVLSTRAPGGADAERIADVPIYWTDSLVRRASSLQKTADARAPRAIANRATLTRFGLAPGDRAWVRQGAAVALLECGLDPRLPDGVVRVPAGHPSTSALGPMFGPVRLERAG
ncbi:MAG TPA: NADH-quinone oxidoreductase subunit NuoG [Burkholderiaceae bacterium]|jgi:NADH-quinone oxidoreductase subunit G|nr:NADH-quinone oxidoreductase subunit NuoG [Burkholderiaceae bacterium]